MQNALTVRLSAAEEDVAAGGGLGGERIHLALDRDVARSVVGLNLPRPSRVSNDRKGGPTLRKKREGERVRGQPQ